MSLRLVVTADIHGLYSAWKKICAQLVPSDLLIIAGDAFGTRYPLPSNPDYRPADIRAELVDIPHIIVSGNCDLQNFLPELTYTHNFVWENINIFIHHGDTLPLIPAETNLVISGHTHVPMVQYLEGHWLVNPGSPALPRAYVASYAVITAKGIQVLNLNGTTLITADFASKVVQQKPALLHASADYE
jgi:uncharacterized protein